MSAVPDLYRCFHCFALNDRLTADFCSCIAVEPTLLCSSCGRCFCDALLGWRKLFIADATPEYRRRLRERQTAVPSSPDGRLRRPLVLIVDDDRVVHAMMARLLREFSGSVLYCENGAQALALAREVHPDLIIADALMPHLDGRELARILKSEPATAGCKVAIMTALYKGYRYRSEAFRRFSVDEYLEKPVSPDKLRSLLASVTAEAPEAAVAS